MPFRKFFNKEPEPVRSRPADHRYFADRGEYPELRDERQRYHADDQLFPADAMASDREVYDDYALHQQPGRVRRRMPLTTLEALLQIKANGLNGAKAA
jgi:hypothetical protein